MVVFLQNIGSFQNNLLISLADKNALLFHGGLYNIT
jgi:hypothetical protein